MWLYLFRNCWLVFECFRCFIHILRYSCFNNFWNCLFKHRNIFLSTQGQISVVSTIVSAGNGFICGAYMPISSMSKVIPKITSFLPGTYGTGLFRNCFISGGLKELNSVGIPEKVTDLIANQVDANLYFLIIKFPFFRCI